MRGAPGMQTADFNFSNEDFELIARYAARSYGLDIKIEKKGLIYARLARRIRALGMDSFKSYCAFATGTQAGPEREELLSALTTNVTSFFRERHHFDMLRDRVLPNLRDKVQRGGALRIWSAGCSSGQEPYSIAATILETWPDAAQFDIQIHATDVDPRIVQMAEVGSYRALEADGLAPQLQKSLFTASSLTGDTRTILPTLHKWVTFDRLNLIRNWSFPTPFDVIFCRNVVIYFERATQHTLWGKFSTCLAPSGHLFIGHSERLTGPAASKFENVGVTAFVKSAP